MRRDLGDGYELDDDPSGSTATPSTRTSAERRTGRRAAPREPGRADRRERRASSASTSDGRQVGFARAVDCDGARFVYLADVYVLDEYRGRGLGVELVREMVENGPYAERRWLLHTRDAHDLYRSSGSARTSV